MRPPGALLADAGAISPFRGRLLFCDVFEDVVCSPVCMLVLRGPPCVPASPTSRVPVFSYFPAFLCLFTGLEPISTSPCDDSLIFTQISRFWLYFK